MDKKKLIKLLEDVRGQKIEIDDALRILKSLPYEDLGFAKIDTHRDLRKGFPEVIFCKGKTTEQISKIVENISQKNEVVMATKANKDVFEAIKKTRKDATYYKEAKIVLIGQKEKIKTKNTILVVTAGTSDIPIAEEAVVTAEAMGNTVEKLYDIGVAGIHRLFSNTEKLLHANVLIVVARSQKQDSAFVINPGKVPEQPVSPITRVGVTTIRI